MPLQQYARGSAIALTGSDQAAHARANQFLGITVRETAGSTAAVRVYDNASAASGTILAVVALAANASQTVWFGPAGVRAANGIYVDIVSGAVEGSVFFSEGV